MSSYGANMAGVAKRRRSRVLAAEAVAIALCLISCGLGIAGIAVDFNGGFAAGVILVLSLVNLAGAPDG